MTSKVICFASAKGGSGKTVISASLAKFLAGLGKKVLLLDMDAATNGLSIFYSEKLINAKRRLAEKKLSARGVFETTNGKSPTPFTIEEGIEMIPATYVMKQTEASSVEDFRRSVSERLSALRDKYDYIILDAQAGSDIYAEVAIENADEIVIVTEYDPVSAEGVERLKQLFPKALSPNKTWILFNKLLPEFAKSLGKFLVVARYLSPVPWDAEVVRAYTSRRLAINMERGNDYTLAIIQTARSFLGDEIEEEINHWKKDKEKLLREPPRKELELMEEEIPLIEKKKIDMEYQLRNSQNRSKRFLANSVMIFTTSMTLLAAYFIILREPPSLFYLTIAVALAISMLGVLLTVVPYRIERWSREKEKILEGEIAALTLNLEDLKVRRQKLKTLTESDLETLLKKRGD